MRFQFNKSSRITKFIKFTKLQITIFSKTNFDEITNLTGPTKFNLVFLQTQGWKWDDGIRRLAFTLGREGEELLNETRPATPIKDNGDPIASQPGSKLV